MFSPVRQFTLRFPRTCSRAWYPPSFSTHTHLRVLSSLRSAHFLLLLCVSHRLRGRNWERGDNQSSSLSCSHFLLPSILWPPALNTLALAHARLLTICFFSAFRAVGAGPQRRQAPPLRQPPQPQTPQALRLVIPARPGLGWPFPVWPGGAICKLLNGHCRC
jgi:hypothetical protein